MKFLLLSLVVFGLTCSVLTLSDVNSLKQQVINGFISKLRMKSEESLIPSLFNIIPSPRVGLFGLLPDPIVIPDFDEAINLDDQLIFNASLQNGVITGLSSWNDDIKFNIFNLKVIYTSDLPNAQFSGNYKAYGAIYYMYLLLAEASGFGNAFASISGAHLDVSFNFVINMISKVSVKNVDVNIRFNELSLFAENAYVNSVAIDWEAINGGVKPSFDDIWTTIKPEVVNQLTIILKEFVERRTLAELIEIINQIGKPKP